MRTTLLDFQQQFQLSFVERGGLLKHSQRADWLDFLLDQLGSGLSCSPVPLNPTSDHKDPLASVKFVNFFFFLLLLDQADIKLLINSNPRV